MEDEQVLMLKRKIDELQGQLMVVLHCGKEHGCDVCAFDLEILEAELDGDIHLRYVPLAEKMEWYEQFCANRK